jgi:hypothetical protein
VNFAFGWKLDIVSKLESASSLRLEVNEGRKHPISEVFVRDSSQYKALMEWAKRNDGGWKWNYLFFVGGVPTMVVDTPNDTVFRLEITPYGKVIFGVDLDGFYKDIPQKEYLSLRKAVFGDPHPEILH